MRFKIWWSVCSTCSTHTLSKHLPVTPQRSHAKQDSKPTSYLGLHPLWQCSLLSLALRTNNICFVIYLKIILDSAATSLTQLSIAYLTPDYGLPSPSEPEAQTFSSLLPLHLDFPLLCHCFEAPCMLSSAGNWHYVTTLQSRLHSFTNINHNMIVKVRFGDIQMQKL